MRALGIMATSGRGSSKGRATRLSLSLREGIEVLLVVTLLGIIVIGVHTLRSAEAMPVHRVHFEGQWSHLGRAELIETASEHMRGAFFTIDLLAIEHALQALPWVETASVRRQWPDTFVIRITEQRPIARWGKHGLLNSQAQVFYPIDPKALSQLPVLYGPPGRERGLMVQFRKITALLAPGDVELRALIEDDRGSRHLLIDRGIPIALGRGDHRSALKRFMRVYRRTLAPRHEAIARIDLRYTNGFSVAWKSDQRNDGDKEAS